MSEQQRTIAYRPDIDGLRAIAVLVVVLFHVDIHVLEGGFLGVDVFFVISGFLISSILEKRISNKELSLKDFYFSRIRRLLPASFVVVAATFIAAIFIMTPDDFIAFSKTAIGAIASVSNFVFYAESGYWDTASELKPLLHTWSLGVEEQFYLIWPLTLMAIFAWFKSRVAIAYFVISLLALALSEWMRLTDPSAAFFLFPFRIFEFSFGALAIYIARSSIWKRLLSSTFLRELIPLAGLVIILASVWIYDGATPFPGVYAMPPVIGTMLVLMSAQSQEQYGAVTRLFLSNPLSVWLGRISYSMYLVHWPIIVLYRYETGLELSVLEQVGLLIVTLIASILLYYGIEKKFRLRKSAAGEALKSLSPKAFTGVIVAAGVGMAAICTHVIFQQGWSWRMPAISYTPDIIEAGKQKRFDRIRAGCKINQISQRDDCAMDAEINVLVFGNSHEPDGYNF